MLQFYIGFNTWADACDSRGKGNMGRSRFYFDWIMFSFFFMNDVSFYMISTEVLLKQRLKNVRHVLREIFVLFDR